MAQKSYRVIAPNAALKHLRTVNVTVVAPVAKTHKSVAQVAGVPPASGIVETVMAAASPTPGLPVFHIPGYSGPS